MHCSAQSGVVVKVLSCTSPWLLKWGRFQVQNFLHVKVWNMQGFISGSAPGFSDGSVHGSPLGSSKCYIPGEMSTQRSPHQTLPSVTFMFAGCRGIGSVSDV